MFTRCLPVPHTFQLRTMAFVSSFTPTWRARHALQPAPHLSQRRAQGQFMCSANSRPRPQPDTQNKNTKKNEKDDKKRVQRASRPIRGGGKLIVGNVRQQGKKYVKLPPNPPGLRVASGTVKGKLIKSPDVYLRPMMAKVREALFSILLSLGVLRDDFTVLDLYCGSGSVGIEALSRGMKSATFIDYARECIETTKKNLINCGFETKSDTYCQSVEDFLKSSTQKFDLITITPPYEEVDYHDLMSSVVNSECVGDGTFVVVEYPIELGQMPDVIENGRLVGVRNRRYGRTMIAVYACQPHVDLDLKPEEFVLATSKRKKQKRLYRGQ